MPESFARFLSELSAEDRPRLTRALKRHAVRQLATLKASGAALLHAPTLDDRIGAIERARDELEHLERASEVYRELADADLLSEAEMAAKDLPVPGSWTEASVAQLVLCLAARVDLDRGRHEGPLFAEATRKALAEEVEHVAAARVALSEICGESGEGATQTAELVGRWLPVALGSLDEEEARQRYLEELEGEARAIGFSLK